MMLPGCIRGCSSGRVEGSRDEAWQSGTATSSTNKINKRILLYIVEICI
jgi:hypothetical protein